MNKWSLFFTGLLTAVLLSLCGTAIASAYSEKNLTPYEWRQYGRWIEIEADVLCWKPCMNNMDLAAVVTESGGRTEVQYKNFHFDWETGFKIEGWIPEVFPSWNVGSSYYRIHTTDSTHQHYEATDANNGIISPMIFKVSGFSQTWEHGKQSSDLLYNEWDLNVGYDITFYSNHHFTPYFGLAGLYLEHKVEGEFSTHSIHTSVNTEWTLNYSGIGLRAGTEYEYNLSKCLKFITNANVSLLEGNDSTENKQFLTVAGTKTELKLHDDHCFHHVYGYHVALGLTYNECLCGWDYKLVLGYEFVGWHHLPNHRVFYGNNSGSEISGSSSPRTRTVGFQGLVAGCSMVF